MPYTLIIRDEAIEEMREGFLYYEDVQSGLGERFLSELQKRYNEIQEHPQFYGFIGINHNQEPRSNFLKAYKITYLHFAEEFGARQSRTHYDRVHRK